MVWPRQPWTHDICGSAPQGLSRNSRRLSPDAYPFASAQGGVGRLVGRHRLSRAEDALRRRMVAGPVDRLDDREPAAPEAEGGKRASGGITAHDPFVDLVRKSGDHQLEVALVASEPGGRVLGLGLAGEAHRHAFPLVDGVLIDSSRVRKPSAALGKSTQSPIAEMAGSEVCKCAS